MADHDRREPLSSFRPYPSSMLGAFSNHSLAGTLAAAVEIGPNRTALTIAFHIAHDAISFVIFACPSYT